jgi:ribosomal protein L37AE/L43A
MNGGIVRTSRKVREGMVKCDRCWREATIRLGELWLCEYCYHEVPGEELRRIEEDASDEDRYEGGW